MEATDMLHGSLVSILNDTTDYQRKRQRTFNECLDVFQPQSGEYLHRFITVDEIWMYCNILKIKQNSKL